MKLRKVRGIQPACKDLRKSRFLGSGNAIEPASGLVRTQKRVHTSTSTTSSKSCQRTLIFVTLNHFQQSKSSNPRSKAFLHNFKYLLTNYYLSSKLSVAILKDHCRKRGLKVGGTKPVLVARLEDSDVSSRTTYAILLFNITRFCNKLMNYTAPCP